MYFFKPLKPLLASAILYIVSFILVLSVDTTISGLNSSFNDLYKTIFIDKLLPSNNYLAITLLFFIEWLLWHFVCKSQLPELKLNKFESVGLLLFIVGIVTINSEYLVISIFGFICTIIFTLSLGNKLFSDCNGITPTNIQK